MAETINPNILLVIALAPLVSAIIAGLFGKAIGRVGSHSVTTASVALSFALSVWVLIQVVGGAHYNGTVYTWMQVGSLKMDVGFLIDSLSALMMVRNSARSSIQMVAAWKNASTRYSAECTGLRAVITRKAANSSTAEKI